MVELIFALGMIALAVVVGRLEKENVALRAEIRRLGGNESATR
jgi:hypothetical protein